MCREVAAALAAEFPGLTRRQMKDRLRAANTDTARDIAYVTGMSHAAVNAELNRRTGVDRVTGATVEQLQGLGQALRIDVWDLDPGRRAREGRGNERGLGLVALVALHRVESAVVVAEREDV